MLYRLIIGFLISLSFLRAQAQDSPVAGINDFISFNNECTHGMLIVHRLLENFNQDVNKFVDLESKQVNFYSNKDLPKNLFEDPEHWFYERTPYEWYDILKASKIDTRWKDPLLDISTQMRQIVRLIDRIRFEAEDFIRIEDLKERSSQEKIYEILEKGVILFEQFYLRQIKMKAIVSEFATSQKVASDPFEKIHDQAFVMLESLRYKRDDDWVKELRILEAADQSSMQEGDQRNKINQFIKATKEFIETADVAAEYKQYGKYYYYHNSKLLNYVNRYGNGYVNAYNMTIDGESKLKLMEIPHFYQVVYPNRWTEDVPLASMDPSILALPERLKERKINLKDRVILVDSEVVELEIFDHQMIDGDIVSVNFNGDWILEDHLLKGKPYPLKVKLNPSGKNYLLLHAINLGRKPPNTMALRYTFHGKRETVVLSSDLDESEMIEIRIN